MRVWRVAIVTASTISAAACGLFPDVSPLDSADSSIVDAAHPDAATDSSDATFDATSDAADARTSPCASSHTFCDDFDQGALGAKWDSIGLDSGPLVLTTSNVVTPPNALQATGNENGSASALLKTFPAANHTHIELDVRVENPPDTTLTELDVVALIMTTPPPGYNFADLNFQRYQGSAQLEEYLSVADGGASAGQDLMITEALASWRHVVLDLDFTTQTWSVAIDAAPATSFVLNPKVPKSAFTLNVGVAYISSHLGGDWNAFIDNVVVDQY